MIALLQSIRKEWTDLIVSGKKTVEVRKKGPAIYPLPDMIKVYIYETKARGGTGKVIGYYYAKISKFDFEYSEWAHSVAPAGAVLPLSENQLWSIVTTKGCISEDRFREYLSSEKDDGNYIVYLYYINQLTLFDKPKNISEFYGIASFEVDYNNECIIGKKGSKLKRAPQDWRYIYLEDDKIKKYRNKII